MNSQIQAIFSENGIAIRTLNLGSPNSWTVIDSKGGRWILWLDVETVWLQNSQGLVSRSENRSLAFLSSFESQISSSELICRSPGKVHSLIAQPRQRLNKGDLILKIESMKMEIEVRADFSLQIEKFMVQVGDFVQAQQVLAKLGRIEPAG